MTFLGLGEMFEGAFADMGVKVKHTKRRGARTLIGLNRNSSI
jgi:hypothetical protein